MSVLKKRGFDSNKKYTKNIIGIELCKKFKNNKENVSTKSEKRFNILIRKYFNEQNLNCPIRLFLADTSTNNVYVIADSLEGMVLLCDPISNDIYISNASDCMTASITDESHGGHMLRATNIFDTSSQAKNTYLCLNFLHLLKHNDKSSLRIFYKIFHVIFSSVFNYMISEDNVCSRRSILDDNLSDSPNNQIKAKRTLTSSYQLRESPFKTRKSLESPNKTRKLRVITQKPRESPNKPRVITQKPRESPKKCQNYYIYNIYES